MALTVIVPVNDSPKFYYMLRDIYGDPLDIAPDDFVSLNYTVYQNFSGVLTPIESFQNIPIPTSQFYTTAQSYPTNIKGVTSSELEDGYNLEVFPYAETNSDGAWESPFTQQNATYVLSVTVSYYMTDPALSGSNLIAKTYSVTVQTRG